MFLLTDSKTDKRSVRVPIGEAEKIGLYSGPEYASDAPKKKAALDRGLGTYDKTEAEQLVALLNEALSDPRPAAHKLLQDVLRIPAKIPFGDLTRRMKEAAGARSKKKLTAEDALDAILEQQMRTLLRPLVAEWDGGSTAGEVQRLRYRKQVEQFVDAEMLVTDFTKKTIKLYLTKTIYQHKSHYTNKAVTKRTAKHHAIAISLFGRWLEENEHIPVNPVPAVIKCDEMQYTPKELKRKKQLVYYTQDEAKKLVMACEGETRAMLALMFATAVELGAVYNIFKQKGPVGPTLFRRDFHLKSTSDNTACWFIVRGLAGAHPELGEGLKNEFRDERWLDVPLDHGHDFYWRVVEAHLKDLKPDDPFTQHGIKYHKKRFDAALTACGLTRPHGRLFHPARHTFAKFWKPLVETGRAGMYETDQGELPRDSAWGKQHLGHADQSALWDTLYGAQGRRKAPGTAVDDDANTEYSRRRRLRVVGDRKVG